MTHAKKTYERLSRICLATTLTLLALPVYGLAIG